MNTEKTSVNCYVHGARYYDPQLARWHASDPLSELYSSSSPYAYVRNNPVNFIDPNGMYEDRGPSADERAKINEGITLGSQLGSGLRRMNFYSNVDQMYLEFQLRDIYNAVATYMPDNGVATIHLSNDIMTVLAPVVGSLPGLNSFSINGFLEYTYKNVGGRFRSLNVNGHYGSQSSKSSSKTSDDSFEPQNLIESPITDIATFIGSSSGAYGNSDIPTGGKIVNRHYYEYIPHSKIFRNIGAAGDAYSIGSSMLNVIVEGPSLESLSDLLFAAVGAVPFYGDLLSVYYIGIKDQIGIREENIINNRNPMYGIHISATGDVWPFMK